MSLSERLGIAAKVRASTPAPLPELELTTREVHVDVTGPTAAVDLRTPTDAPPRVIEDRAPEPHPPHDAESSQTPRFSLRARLERRAKDVEPEPAPRPTTDAPPCPRCGTPARIDINDRTRGILYLSCDECFTMWQAPARAEAPSH